MYIDNDRDRKVKYSVNLWASRCYATTPVPTPRSPFPHSWNPRQLRYIKTKCRQAVYRSLCQNSGIAQASTGIVKHKKKKVWARNSNITWFITFLPQFPQVSSSQWGCEGLLGLRLQLSLWSWLNWPAEISQHPFRRLEVSLDLFSLFLGEGGGEAPNFRQNCLVNSASSHSFDQKPLPQETGSKLKKVSWVWDLPLLSPGWWAIAYQSRGSPAPDWEPWSQPQYVTHQIKWDYSQACRKPGYKSFVRWTGGVLFCF